MTETITTPVKAKFQIIDGKPIMVAATWADVPVDAVAEMLAKALGLWKEGDRPDIR